MIYHILIEWVLKDETQVGIYVIPTRYDKTNFKLKYSFDLSRCSVSGYIAISRVLKSKSRFSFHISKFYYLDSNLQALNSEVWEGGWVKRKGLEIPPSPPLSPYISSQWTTLDLETGSSFDFGEGRCRFSSLYFLDTESFAYCSTCVCECTAAERRFMLQCRDHDVQNWRLRG